MRKRGRVDNNQAEIVQALRKAGCTVQILSNNGQGCPDILVGRQHRNWLLEIKGDRASLTPAERSWHHKWRGQVTLVRSSEEALLAVGAVDEDYPKKSANA